jgi:hypothetical protein
MKREQAIEMLRQWHEECIEAAKGLPAGYYAIVEERERTCGTFHGTAVVWDGETMREASEWRKCAFYEDLTDEEDIAAFNENLEAFKADVKKVAEQNKKQHAA